MTRELEYVNVFLMADEKKISRQTAWQRRQLEKGLCRLCNEPVALRKTDGKPGVLCEGHSEKFRVKAAARYAIYKAAVAAIRAGVGK